MSLRFFILGGVILLVSAGLQLLTRRREPGAPPGRRAADPAVIRAVMFAIVGVLAVLVGLGVIPLLRMR